SSVEDAAQAVEQNIGAEGQSQDGVRDHSVGSFTAGNSFQRTHRANGLAHKSSSEFCKEFSNRAASAPRRHEFLLDSGRARTILIRSWDGRRFIPRGRSLQPFPVAQASAWGVGSCKDQNPQAEGYTT